ncbi:MAG: FtsX-like permease family protein, partial [Acidobacteria bacterium]|nr:FtsX-like permease family protein [Acidobacteriota bacterium]
SFAVYLPHTQNAWGQMYFVLRAETDPGQLTAAAHNELRAIDKDQPAFNVRTLEQIFSERLGPQRLSAFMFASFALIALVLAAVGIYAVISYSVAQRTHEIGIRLALGAQKGDILRLVMGHGLKLILFGVVVGLLAAIAVTRLMVSILYGVNAMDALTFAAISGLLVGVALLACYVPARRATKVDPMVALRYE